MPGTLGPPETVSYLRTLPEAECFELHAVANVLFCAVHELVHDRAGEDDKAARVANRGEFIEASKVRAMRRGKPNRRIGIAARWSVRNNWPSEKAAVKEPR